MITEEQLQAAHKAGVERAELGMTAPPLAGFENFVLYVSALTGYTAEKQRQSYRARLQGLLIAYNDGYADASAGLQKDIAAYVSPDDVHAYLAGYFNSEEQSSDTRESE